MTKRRWLQTAIEESKKPQITMPWARDTAKADTAALAGRIIAVKKDARV